MPRRKSRSVKVIVKKKASPGNEKKPRPVSVPVHNARDLSIAYMEKNKLDPTVSKKLKEVLSDMGNKRFSYQGERKIGNNRYLFKVRKRDKKFQLSVTRQQPNNISVEWSKKFNNGNDAIFHCFYLEFFAKSITKSEVEKGSGKEPVLKPPVRTLERKTAVVLIKKKRRTSETPVPKKIVKTVSSSEVNKEEQPADDSIIASASSRLETDLSQNTEKWAASADEDQRKAILAPADSSFMVEAPPGTGKTWCLVKRLRRLVELLPDGTPPGAITVLSFTRAAVGEIRKRVREEVEDGAADALRYVNVRTFDSFAFRILDELLEVPRSDSYDENISRFNEFLQDDLADSSSGLNRIRWLLVDEVQDLVGVRMKMVSLLADRVLDRNGSINLFGDSDQSINDYQKPLGEIDFIVGIKKKLRQNLSIVKLKRSHRYKDSRELEKFNDKARGILADHSLSVSDRYKKIKSFIPSEDSNIGMYDLVDRLKKEPSSAVLCRSNIQVYQTGEWLVSQGVPVNIIRKNSQTEWPGWIAVLFSGYRSKMMSVHTLERRYSERYYGKGPGFEDIIRNLTEYGVLSRSIISVTDLAWKVENRKVPEKLYSDSGETVVSTIHKAKGLEYPYVNVLDIGKVKTEENLRVRYVAMSRAVKKLRILKPVADERTEIFSKRTYNKRFHRQTESGKEILLEGPEDFEWESFLSHIAFRKDRHRLIEILNHSETENYLIKHNTRVRKGWNEYWLYMKIGGIDYPILRCGTPLNNIINRVSELSFSNGSLIFGNLQPSGYIARVMYPDIPLVETITGPTRFIRIPFFEGFRILERE